MGEELWPNRHITYLLLVWLKKLNSQFILIYLRYMWGRGLVENVICWRGLAENVIIPSYGREPKVARINGHMIFERSLYTLKNQYFIGIV